MGVGQRVVNGFSIPAELHQSGLLQDTELMGNGALGHSQKVGDVADTEFSRGKGVEDADAGGITENFVEISQFVEHFICRRFPGEGYAVMVADIAEFYIGFMVF